MKQKFILPIAIALLIDRPNNVRADVMISNLNQLWTVNGTMGNFETMIPDNGFGFLFRTGANPYNLNSVTFEELGDLTGVQVAIYSVQSQNSTLPVLFTGAALSLAGTLGNPTVGSRPTQWPNLTSFIDYTPTTTVTLAPNTLYFIAATEPADGTDNTALTFNFQYNYDISADWTALPFAYSGSQTSSDSGSWMLNTGPGSLMLEVNATPAPEPSSYALLLLGLGLYRSRRIRRRPQPKLCTRI